MKYSYSTDEERYQGEFDSVEAACDEAATEVGIDGDFWVGENVSPPSPETYFTVSDWIERVNCDDEYSGDWAEGWDLSTKAQRGELETEVRKVIAGWLDRHQLRPKFWNIKKPRHFFVAGKIGDVYEIEAMS